MIMFTCGLLLLSTYFAKFAYSLEISFETLESGNSTCPYSSCINANETINYDLGDRNCLCDEKCTAYGDCCPDSPFHNVYEERKNYRSYNCVKLSNTSRDSVYMKTTCPSKWKFKEIREKCVVSKYKPVNDPLLSTPVTSLKSFVTYGNIYCALCNQDSQFEYWKNGLDCPELKQDVLKANEDNITANLKFNSTDNKWQVLFDGNVYKCDVVPILPKNITRFCVPDVINTCPSTFPNKDVKIHCESYTSIVYSKENVYRNAHCAICNNEDIQVLSCSNALQTRGKDIIPSFSILFDFRGGKTVGKIQPCKEDQLYDPFFKICREIIQHDDDESNSTNNNYTTVSNYSQSLKIEKLNCSKRFVLNSSDFVTVDHNMVQVAVYNRKYRPGEYIIRNDGSLEICIDDTIATQYITKYKPYAGIITLIGIMLSIICLCLHLLAFIFVKELHNLSGKNLASFCTALLIAYCSFLAGNMLEDKGSCILFAITTYYFFLASFFWLLTMSFDIWKTLRASASELRVKTGNQWRKFLVYSAWSWIMPGKIVLICMLFEMAPKDSVPDKLRPHFGSVSCWFGQGHSLLIFFGLPLAIVMILNFTFFSNAAYLIYSSQSMARYSTSSDTKRDFRLYMRLAVIMGLTWIIGLFGAVIDNDVIWIIFVILNTAQGLFIFIAFTCRRRVLRALKQIHKESEIFHMPNISWFGSSSEFTPPNVTQNKRDSATSTTTY